MVACYETGSPITKASGTKRVVLARYARNRRLGDALFLQAYSALRASPGARAFLTDTVTTADPLPSPPAPSPTGWSAFSTVPAKPHPYDEHLAWHSEPDKLSPAA